MAGKLEIRKNSHLGWVWIKLETSLAIWAMLLMSAEVTPEVVEDSPLR